MSAGSAPLAGVGLCVAAHVCDTDCWEGVYAFPKMLCMACVCVFVSTFYLDNPVSSRVLGSETGYQVSRINPKAGHRPCFLRSFDGPQRQSRSAPSSELEEAAVLFISLYSFNQGTLNIKQRS